MRSSVSVVTTSWPQARGGAGRWARALTPVIAAVGLSSSATAVTCVNGIPASNPDAVYTVHGDGTATDTRTGLMWKVCSEGQTWSTGSCTGTAVGKTWATALADAEAHVFAGYSDWRLPNVKELFSLVEKCAVNPAINTTVFPSTPSSYVWSGSPYAYNSSNAWSVNFSYGNAAFNYRSYAYSVRLVRGG